MTLTSRPMFFAKIIITIISNDIEILIIKHDYSLTLLNQE